MCGILASASLNSTFQKENLQNALQSLSHRGPDAYGEYFKNNIYLGHRRLSIIDLEGGTQPMYSDDKRFVIVFNGEIYNYMEIASDFDMNLKSHSDTEVLLKLFELKGYKCLNYLRGMFAFVIYDTFENKFFIARDHFGIKPLHIYLDGQYIVIASELQAIRSIPNLDLSLDLNSIDTYLRLNYIPAPFSAFKKIQKLEPGNFAEFNISTFQLDVKNYYHFQFEVEYYQKSNEELIEECKKVLKDSVEHHMIADVPYGTFLSGGIDSTLITSMMYEHKGTGISTFSIDFDGDLSELSYAKEVADRFQLNHFIKNVKPDSLGLIDDLVKHSGEPFGDSSILPTFYLSKMSRDHVKMVLSGDGADEFFGGYKSYERWNNRLNSDRLSLRSSLMIFISKMKHLGKDPRRSLNNWLKETPGIKNDFRKTLWNSDHIDNFSEDILELKREFIANENLDHVQQVQSLDINFLLQGNMLPKVDIASMMNSLEVRTPFVDIRVADFASKLPRKSYFTANGRDFSGKKLLKSIVKEKFSSEFVNRPKHGFTVPLNDWISEQSEYKNMIRYYMNSEESPLMLFFNSDALRTIYESKNKDTIWSLLILAKWMEKL